jgi:hypothetical protein
MEKTMHPKVREALNKAFEELQALPPDELLALAEKHSNGDVAKLLQRAWKSRHRDKNQEARDNRQKSRRAQLRQMQKALELRDEKYETMTKANHKHWQDLQSARDEIQALRNELEARVYKATHCPDCARRHGK